MDDMDNPPKQRRRRSIRLLRASSNFNSPPPSSPYGSTWVNQGLEQAADSTNMTMNLTYVLSSDDHDSSPPEQETPNLPENLALLGTESKLNEISTKDRTGDYFQASFLQVSAEDAQHGENISDTSLFYPSFSFSPDMPLDGKSFDEVVQFDVTPTHTIECSKSSSFFSDRFSTEKDQAEMLDADGEFKTEDSNEAEHGEKTDYLNEAYDFDLGWPDNHFFGPWSVSGQEAMVDHKEDSGDWDAALSFPCQGEEEEVSPQLPNSNSERQSSSFTARFEGRIPAESRPLETESSDIMNCISLIDALLNMNIGGTSVDPAIALSESCIGDENLIQRYSPSSEIANMDDIMVENGKKDFHIESPCVSPSNSQCHKNSSVDVLPSLQSDGPKEIGVEDSLTSKNETQKRRRSVRRSSRCFSQEELSSALSETDKDTCCGTSPDSNACNNSNMIGEEGVEVTNLAPDSEDYVPTLSEICPNVSDDKSYQQKKHKGKRNSGGFQKGDSSSLLQEVNLDTAISKSGRCKRKSGGFHKGENNGLKQKPTLGNPTAKSIDEHSFDSHALISSCDKENSPLENCGKDKSGSVVCEGVLSNDTAENEDSSLLEINQRARRTRRTSTDNRQRTQRAKKQCESIENQDDALRDIYSQKNYQPVKSSALASIKETQGGKIFGQQTLRLINFPENYAPTLARKKRRAKKALKYCKNLLDFVTDEEFKIRLHNMELALENVE